MCLWSRDLCSGRFRTPTTLSCQNHQALCLAHPSTIADLTGCHTQRACPSFARCQTRRLPPLPAGPPAAGLSRLCGTTLRRTGTPRWRCAPHAAPRSLLEGRVAGEQGIAEGSVGVSSAGSGPALWRTLHAEPLQRRRQPRRWAPRQSRILGSAHAQACACICATAGCASQGVAPERVVAPKVWSHSGLCLPARRWWPSCHSKAPPPPTPPLAQVVAFPLGSWVGGLFTTLCLRYLTLKGYRLTTVTPGGRRWEGQQGRGRRVPRP